MMPENVRIWCGIACERAVVLRALKYAVVVGAVLVAINHGGAILRGDIGADRLIQIGLTVLVPYCVSALSSVGAVRTLRTPEAAAEETHPS